VLPGGAPQSAAIAAIHAGTQIDGDMARIRSAVRGDLLRISVAGRLTTADMGRLEHACSPALIRRPANLELDLRGVTYVDATAIALIRRIAERGAHLLGVPRVLEDAVSENSDRHA
jgi:hypothetical protein